VTFIYSFASSFLGLFTDEIPTGTQGSKRDRTNPTHFLSADGNSLKIRQCFYVIVLAPELIDNGRQINAGVSGISVDASRETDPTMLLLRRPAIT